MQLIEREELKYDEERYFAAVAVCVMAMSMFTGCAGNDGKDIGKDAAKTAAFSDAGVTEDEITRLKVSKDHDDGRSIMRLILQLHPQGKNMIMRFQQKMEAYFRFVQRDWTREV